MGFPVMNLWIEIDHTQFKSDAQNMSANSRGHRHRPLAGRQANCTDTDGIATYFSTQEAMTHAHNG